MSPSTLAIEAPGGFAPVMAVGSRGRDGEFALVSQSSPLPTVALLPTAPAPLSGSTVSHLLVGPFVPAPLTPVYLTLSGEWQGTVEVLRTTDDGVTLHSLTLAGVPWGRYRANACEPVWSEGEAGAALYLRLTPTAGDISYRVSQ